MDFVFSAERHAMKLGWTISAIYDWHLTEAETGRLIGRNHRPVEASTICGDRSRIELHNKPLMSAEEPRQHSTEAGFSLKPISDR